MFGKGGEREWTAACDKKRAYETSGISADYWKELKVSHKPG